MTEPIQDYYDTDVAKLNALAAKSAARAEELKVENEQLRKLVQRMYGHIKKTCIWCDGMYCSSFDEDNECCIFDSLARELGIEVDT